MHTASTYVPLYSKLEHRVLLLIGWPLSSFLQLERFLNFSLRVHRNAHLDRLSYCSSLFTRTTQVCLKNTVIRQTQSTTRFVISHGAKHTPCTHLSALNVRGKTLATTRARQYRFYIHCTDTPRNPTRSLQPVGENAMLMHMCV